MKKHPLLIYHRIYGAWRVPTFLIALFAGIAWWFAPDVEFLKPEWIQGILASIAFVSLGLFIFALIAPMVSYIQCKKDVVFVSTPLYRFAISYSRVYTCRTTTYQRPPKLGMLEEELLAPFEGQTTLFLELKSYPINEKLLRRFLHRGMFSTQGKGFFIHTKDRQGLSIELDSRRSERTGRAQ